MDENCNFKQYKPRKPYQNKPKDEIFEQLKLVGEDNAD